MGTELSWAVPIDNEHVRGISIVAWPLENGAPKQDWRAGTDVFFDIRPGSMEARSYGNASASPTISKRRKVSARSRSTRWKPRPLG